MPIKRFSLPKVAVAFALAATAGVHGAAGSEAGRRTDASLRAGRLTIPVGGAPVSVAVGEENVWVLVGGVAGERLLRLNPATGALRSTISLGKVGYELGAVTTGSGSVFVVAGDQLFRIDPARNKVTTALTVGGTATSLFATQSAVWVTRASGRLGQLVRVDPRSNRVVARTSMGGGPMSVAAALGSVWVANSSPSSVMRIDPRTNRVVASLLATRFSSAFAVARGTLWVAAERTLVGLNARGQVVRRLRLSRAVSRIVVEGDDPVGNR